MHILVMEGYQKGYQDTVMEFFQFSISTRIHEALVIVMDDWSERTSLNPLTYFDICIAFKITKHCKQGWWPNIMMDVHI